MKLSKFKLLTALAMLIALSQNILAQNPGTPLSDLQSGWAIANYQLEGKDQINAFEKLAAQGDASLNSNPNDAEIQIWTGIIKSTLAGVKGGLGALSLVKAAKAHLEIAIKLDDEALDGSAYTSLGALYNDVPGWPIGFGDKEKSEKNLKKALELNPSGIDTNYFFANFLVSRKKYADAKVYFEKALQASPRPGREIADVGRRKDIELALAYISKKQ